MYVDGGIASNWRNFAYDELNLCEIPLVGSVTQSTSSSGICFSDSVRDASLGKRINRTYLVRPLDRNLPARDWAPTWKDVDVLLALLKLKYESDKFKKSTLGFRLVDLWRTLGGTETKNRQREIQRIRRSIQKWSRLSIDCDLWRYGDAWKTVQFAPLKLIQWEVNTRRGCQNGLTWLLFAGEICESFRGTYKRSFDWDLYLTLKSPAARRLYRFLEKRFFCRKRLAFPLEYLCREKIGLNRNYPARKYKHQLKPAVEELVMHGIVETAPMSYVFGKNAGEPVVRFNAGPASRAWADGKKGRKRVATRTAKRTPNSQQTSRRRIKPVLSNHQLESNLGLALERGPVLLREGYARTKNAGGAAFEQYQRLLVEWAMQTKEVG